MKTANQIFDTVLAAENQEKWYAAQREFSLKLSRALRQHMKDEFIQHKDFAKELKMGCGRLYGWLSCEEMPKLTDAIKLDKELKWTWVEKEWKALYPKKRRANHKKDAKAFEPDFEEFLR